MNLPRAASWLSFGFGRLRSVVDRLAGLRAPRDFCRPCLTLRFLFVAMDEMRALLMLF